MHLNLRPDDFYKLTFREYFAILSIKLPDEEGDKNTINTDRPFFDDDELERLAELRHTAI